MRRSQNGKKAKSTYQKASAILDGLYIALFIVDLFLKQTAFWNSALYLTLVSLVFAIASGSVAYLHSKLPKEQQEQPNWSSASDFGTHPYFTFFLFVMFSIISLFYLLA